MPGCISLLTSKTRRHWQNHVTDARREFRQPQPFAIEMHTPAAAACMLRDASHGPACKPASCASSSAQGQQLRKRRTDHSVPDALAVARAEPVALGQLVQVAEAGLPEAPHVVLPFARLAHEHSAVPKVILIGDKVRAEAQHARPGVGLVGCCFRGPHGWRRQGAGYTGREGVRKGVSFHHHCCGFDLGGSLVCLCLLCMYTRVQVSRRAVAMGMQDLRPGTLQGTCLNGETQRHELLPATMPAQLHLSLQASRRNASEIQKNEYSSCDGSLPCTNAGTHISNHSKHSTRRAKNASACTQNKHSS